MSSGINSGEKDETAGRWRCEVGVGDQPTGAEVAEIQRSALAMAFRWIRELPITDALEVLGDGRAAYDALEAELLAARLDAGASQRSVERLLQKGDKTSKRSAKTRTRRAKAVRKNPTIAAKMRAGAMSPDQADVIASGAEKTDGAAAEDEDLVEAVAKTPPDQARKVVDEWVRDHTSADQVQDRHDRQRRLRSVKRWTTDRDTDILAIEGDTTSIDKVEQAIRNRSQHLYRADGGRNLPAGQHPRTRDQRRFDAAIQLLTGGDRDGETVTGKRNMKTKGSGVAGSGPRSTIIVTMSLDQALGVDTSPVRQVGGGLIAPSVLAEMVCGADLVGLVKERNGLPLWMGRTTRYFTAEQVLALIERDQGCAWCRAHYSLCEAHHIIPWEAPARGPTDIDNGVMVCTDCHHWLHEHDLILVRDADTGTWSTRPARPDEIAPKRRPPPDTSGPKQSAGEAGRSPGPESSRPEQRPPRLYERPRTGALW